MHPLFHSFARSGEIVWAIDGCGRRGILRHTRRYRCRMVVSCTDGGSRGRRRLLRRVRWGRRKRQEGGDVWGVRWGFHPLSKESRQCRPSRLPLLHLTPQEGIFFPHTPPSVIVPIRPLRGLLFRCDQGGARRQCCGVEGRDGGIRYGVVQIGIGGTRGVVVGGVLLRALSLFGGVWHELAPRWEGQRGGRKKMRRRRRKGDQWRWGRDGERGSRKTRGRKGAPRHWRSLRCL